MKEEKVSKGSFASSNIKIGRFPFTGLSQESFVKELRGRGLVKESYEENSNEQCFATRTLWDEDGVCFTSWE